MSHLLGRSKDMIVAEGGRKIAPVECEEALYGLSGVSFFSLEQKENSDIIINVVPRKGRTDIDPDTIAGKIRDLVGSAIPIKVNKADEIPSEKNGKFRFVKRTQ
jgi:phenylacetate-coenzyme A ligase PaaK-like adenylate-forming protein